MAYMINMSILDKELTPTEAFFFFVGATFVYIYPLMLADFYYIDDSWRSQLAGMAWKGEGRILIEWLYQGLSFTRSAPNMFPLPLLIATLMMSFALRSLAYHCLKKITLSSCFVVLPMWYSPFFLQNLSYQYDGPAMALGLIAVIYAFTFRAKGIGAQIVIPSVLIAVALSFYQLNINVFVGLCCVELIGSVNDQKALKSVLLFVVCKVIQLLAGLAVYYFTAYQFLLDNRRGMLSFDGNWFETIKANFYVVVRKVGLLYNEGNAWLCWILLILAIIGFLLVVVRAFRGGGTHAQKIALSLLCLIAIFVLSISISGIALVFEVFNEGARLLVGFSVVLTLLFYLSYQLLIAIHPRLGILLIIPALSMLSFSYAYGRVLNVQKELGVSMAQSVAYDLASHKELRDVKEFYLVVNTTENWLAGASGSTRLIPALKYVLNIDFLLLPEIMPRVGITNVFGVDAEHNEGVISSGSYTAVVNNKFYNIYIVGGDGYIVMKKITDAENYR